MFRYAHADNNILRKSTYSNISLGDLVINRSIVVKTLRQRFIERYNVTFSIIALVILRVYRN